MLHMLESLFDKGHVICADNFFMGIPLVLRAATRNTKMAGTVPKGRTGIPAVAKETFKDTIQGKAERGELRGFWTEVEVEDPKTKKYAKVKGGTLAGQQGGADADDAGAGAHHDQAQDQDQGRCEDRVDHL